MTTKTDRLFAALLGNVEVRKVDFKRDQYLLDNDTLKSKFVKDVVCMANAPGDDGYILIGVKSEKGKPREVVGVSEHHDSADLEAIVNGVIEEPIQFEYYPLLFKGKKCALLCIPLSRARPHWPKKDYGILRNHVFYTRRASGNREASIQEIRDMCLGTIRLSDVAQRKAKVSPHVVDALADMGMSERREAMRKMVKSVALKVGLTGYIQLYSRFGNQLPEFAIVTSTGHRIVRDYAVFVYPWTVEKHDIPPVRIREETLKTRSGGKRAWPSTKARLMKSTLVHISYKGIHTKALQSRPYRTFSYRFANEWNEPWGRVMKWQSSSASLHSKQLTCQEDAEFEFFLPDVSSPDELKDRFEKLLHWVDSNFAEGRLAVSAKPTSRVAHRHTDEP